MKSPADALPLDATGAGDLAPGITGCKIDPPGNANIAGKVAGNAWAAHYAWSAVGCGASKGHTYVRLSTDQVSVALHPLRVSREREVDRPGCRRPRRHPRWPALPGPGRVLLSRRIRRE